MKKILFLILVLCIIAFCFRIGIMINRFFQVDECTFMQISWEMSEGKKLYQDFHEHHVPLFYYFNMVPFFFFKHTGYLFIICRFWNLLVVFGIFYYVYKIANRIFCRNTSIFSVFVLSFVTTFTERSMEVRAISLTTFLFMGALYHLICFIELKSNKALIFLGIYSGLSIVTNHKSAFLLIWINIYLIYYLLKNYSFFSGIRYYLRYILISITPFFVFFIFVYFQGGIADFIYRCYLLPQKWINLTKFSMPFWGIFKISLYRNYWFWISTIAGSVLTVFFYKKNNPLSLNLILPTGIFLCILFIINPAPFPYNQVIVIPTLSILAGYFLYTLIKFLRYHCSNNLFFIIASAILIFYVSSPIMRYSFLAFRSTNDMQLNTINVLLNITSDKQLIYDPCAMHLFRNSPSFYLHFCSYFETEIKPGNISYDMKNKKCGIFLYNYRFVYIPKVDREFIINNFVGYWGPILIPGKKICIDEKAVVPFYFSGNYSVNIISENKKINLLIDGKKISKSTIYLSYGRHRFKLVNTNKPVVIKLTKKIKKNTNLPPYHLNYESNTVDPFYTFSY